MKPLIRNIAVVLTLLGLGGLVHVDLAQASAAMSEAPLADHVLARLDALRDRLYLSPAQQAAWSQTRSATQSAVSAHKPALVRLRNQADELLGSATTSGNDIRYFLEQVDAERESAVPQRHALREQWIKVYEQLSPSQQATVREQLKHELDRFDTLRERLAFFRH